MFCSKCGNVMEDGTAFCPACGAPTTARQLSAGSFPPPAQHAIATSAGGYQQVQYAGFWLRVAAYLIDSAIFGALFFALLIPFAAMTGIGAALKNIHPGANPDELGAILGPTLVLGFVALGIAIFVGGWLYHAVMESSSWEGTVGKKVLNLRVTDKFGQRVSFARASGRYFAKIISGLIPLGIGYILAGFTERRQAVHDMIAECLVLKGA